MTRYSSTMTEALQEIREGFSPKQIKMAIGIASDKRYAGGNMTGAVQAIEKIKKGLADHPQVAAVLKRQNEDNEKELDEGKMKDRLTKAQDLMGPSKNREQGLEFVMKGLKVSKKEATKLVDAVLDMMMNNEVEIDEMKMNDPKLNKIFDKLKKGDKVKLKTSSTISKGNDFVEYLVKSKNVVNKGRVEKITLVTVGNEKAVKKFLYKRDGKVTFAIGDMGASIDDIKEDTNMDADVSRISVDEVTMSQALDIDPKDVDRMKALAVLYTRAMKLPSGSPKQDKFKKEIEKLRKELRMDESVFQELVKSIELDEGMAYKFAAVDRLGKVIGFASDEKDAKDMARRGHTMDSPSKGKGVVGRNSGRVVTLKNPLPDNKKSDMMINRPFPDDMDKFPTNKSATQGKRMGEEDENKMDKPDSAKAVDQSRDDKKKTRIAQLQLQIAKATETINKINTQEKPDA